ncbi:hypothetical protein V491_01626 [Pseudogymnoascus sp. VKM F-3775]|nr:hypothetical protein V491_01626 [Pseudogymnoascus sp. VKM F-3775]
MFAIILAILVGCAITGWTTYALVRDIQRDIAIYAHVVESRDGNYWMQVARTKVYGACYHGCTDCDMASYTSNACAKTAEVNITGVICDGNIMWNWKDRYPVACLEAAGEIYKTDMLKIPKRNHMKRLGFLVLTVLAGIEEKDAKRAPEKRQMATNATVRPGPPPPSTKWKDGASSICTEHEAGLTSPPNKSKKKARRSISLSTLSLATLAAMPGRAAASPLVAILSITATSIYGSSTTYSCINSDSAANQYFVNANRTIFGVVHGWDSNCYNSRKYLDDVLPSVVDCGFELADAVEGDTNLRIANPLIERQWRVTIRVNGFNITSSTETDQSIQCLHDALMTAVYFLIHLFSAEKPTNM